MGCELPELIYKCWGFFNDTLLIYSSLEFSEIKILSEAYASSSCVFVQSQHAVNSSILQLQWFIVKQFYFFSLVLHIFSLNSIKNRECIDLSLQTQILDFFALCRSCCTAPNILSCINQNSTTLWILLTSETLVYC